MLVIGRRCELALFAGMGPGSAAPSGMTGRWGLRVDVLLVSKVTHRTPPPRRHPGQGAKRREPGPIPECWPLAESANSRSSPEWVPDIAAQFRDDGRRGLRVHILRVSSAIFRTPHLAVIPAKKRSDASRDPFRNAGGWQEVRTRALRRSGSRILLRNSGMTGRWGLRVDVLLVSKVTHRTPPPRRHPGQEAKRREPGPIPECWRLAGGANSRSSPEWVPDIAAQFRDDGPQGASGPYFTRFERNLPDTPPRRHPGQGAKRREPGPIPECW
jgi:hypothetical protein